MEMKWDLYVMKAFKLDLSLSKVGASINLKIGRR